MQYKFHTHRIRLNARQAANPDLEHRFCSASAVALRDRYNPECVTWRLGSDRGAWLGSKSHHSRNIERRSGCTPATADIARSMSINATQRLRGYRTDRTDRNDRDEADADNQRPFVWGTCPDCSSTLAVKSGPYGRFLGCSSYPRCDFTENLDRIAKDILDGTAQPARGGGS
jgi:hypothetical protein